MKAYLNISDARYAMNTMAARLSADQIARATARAINHTTAKGKTVAASGVVKRYNLHRSQVKPRMKIKRATQFKQYGIVNAATKPIPLIDFVGTHQTRKGVRVQAMRGKWKTVNSAFIITTKKGRRGVFARGQHEAGGEFKFRDKRIIKTGPDLPIQELSSVSIYTGAVNDGVMEELKPIATVHYEKRLAHEMKNIINGITR